MSRKSLEFSEAGWTIRVSKNGPGVVIARFDNLHAALTRATKLPQAWCPEFLREADADLLEAIRAHQEGV